MSDNKRPVSDHPEEAKRARTESDPEILEVRAASDEPEILEVRAPACAEVTFVEVRASEVALEVRAPVPEVQQVWPRSRMGLCFFCQDRRFLCKLQSFVCTTPMCAVRCVGVCVDCAPQVETRVHQCPLCRGPSRVLRPEAVAAALAEAAEAASAEAVAAAVAERGDDSDDTQEA
jgi:hypothetical protein